MSTNPAGTDAVAARSFEARAREVTTSTLASSRLERFGWEYIEESRGLSAALYRHVRSGLVMASCLEGVGSKAKVIEDLVAALGAEPWPGCDAYKYYYNVAQCGVAMIVNDLITVGALPLWIFQILDLFSAEWHKNAVRKQAVLDGWAEGCRKASAHWPGGETAEMQDLVTPPNVIMAGSATGQVPDGVEPALPSRIEDGNFVVLVASNGVHANGYTGIRKMLADPKIGYDFVMENDERLVDAVLRPTYIYVAGLEMCYSAGLDIRHLVHITGGGLSRFVRQGPAVHYVLDQIATPQPEFAVIQQYSGADMRSMIEALNMGQGLGVIVGNYDDAKQVASIYNAYGQRAWIAGRVHESDVRQVTLVERDLTWTEAA